MSKKSTPKTQHRDDAGGFGIAFYAPSTSDANASSTETGTPTSLPKAVAASAPPKAMSAKPSEEDLIGELEDIESLQARIDWVAKDFKSGKNRYAQMNAWNLGELLGLNLHEPDDWSRSFYCYKRELNKDEGYEYTFSENVHLLKGRVSLARYVTLGSLAEKIIYGQGDLIDDDLKLTKREHHLLQQAYAEGMAKDAFTDVVVACNCVTSSSGVDLDFEVRIGDAGEVYDPCSPYNLRDGNGFDGAAYIEVE